MKSDMRSPGVMAALLLVLGSPACGTRGLGGGTGGTVGTGGTLGTGGAAGSVGTGGAVAGAGGSGGTGGPVGGEGGSGGSGGSPNACGMHDDGLRTEARVTTKGLPATSNPVYDGPAVVERSIGRELLLSLTFDGMPAHATIDTPTPLPPFARGTKLWLSKSPAMDPPPSFSCMIAHAFSVRDRRDGTLLFGGATNQSAPPVGAPASPVQIGAVTPICTATGLDLSCARGSTVVYSSVELAGDTPVIARDSEPTKIFLGGTEYDVRVTAQEQTVGPMICADYCAANGVGVAIRATHLAELIAGLEVGPAPACGQGNDLAQDLFFGLYGVSLSTSYEGSVIYKGRYASNPKAYDFAAPGLVGLNGSPTGLYIEGADDVWPEPAVGQTFWLSYPSFRTQVLRETQQGPILLATHADAGGDGGLRPDGLAPLANLIGVPITLEQACAYTTSVPLWDVVFGTSPPVRVASGTNGTVQIGGRSYRAWVWVGDYVRISIFPAG
jgi:hypothetical protein